MRPRDSMKLRIESMWNGEPALANERASVSLAVEAAGLCLELDAAYHADPPPPRPAGPTPRLWEYEVVEVFLFTDDSRYLEIELGPHGHHLVLELEAPRVIARQHQQLDYEASRREHRWQGRAFLPHEALPPALTCVNAHAIHGLGSLRRYLSAAACPGTRPDFHRRDAALALPAATVEALRR